MQHIKLVTFFPAKPASIQQVFKALLRWQNWQPRPILLFHTFLSYDLWKDHNSREISPFVCRDAYTPVGLNVLALQSLLKQTKPSPPQPIFPDLNYIFFYQTFSPEPMFPNLN